MDCILLMSCFKYGLGFNLSEATVLIRVKKKRVQSLILFLYKPARLIIRLLIGFASELSNQPKIYANAETAILSQIYGKDCQKSEHCCVFQSFDFEVYPHAKGAISKFMATIGNTVLPPLIQGTINCFIPFTFYC